MSNASKYHSTKSSAPTLPWTCANKIQLDESLFLNIGVQRQKRKKQKLHVNGVGQTLVRKADRKPRGQLVTNSAEELQSAVAIRSMI